MDNPYVTLVIGLVAGAAAALIGAMIYGRSQRTGRYGESQQIAKRWLEDKDFEAKVHDILHPKPPKPNPDPIRFLALMQREGRLVDFLLEDVQGYANEQIGAAVRDIHRHCQKVLRDHLVLEEVLKGQEGAATEVPTGFDPSAIRLTGNVTGKPPFRGTLQHHGWRVREIKLQPLPEGQDHFVIQPAEVELA